jgi:hypothetical protein
MPTKEVHSVDRDSHARTGVTWPCRSRAARTKAASRRAALLLLLYPGCLLVGACAVEAERPAIPSDLEAVIAARDIEGRLRLEKQKLGAMVGREGVVPNLLTEGGSSTSVRELIGDRDGIGLLFLSHGEIPEAWNREVAQKGWRFDGKPVYPVLPKRTRFTASHEHLLRSAPEQVLFVETPMQGEMIYLASFPTLFVLDRLGRVALIQVGLFHERSYRVTAGEDTR